MPMHIIIIIIYAFFIQVSTISEITAFQGVPDIQYATT